MSEPGLSGQMPLPSASTLVSSSQTGPLAPISLPPLSLPPASNSSKMDGNSISMPSPRQGMSSVPHSPFPSPNVPSPLVNQPVPSPGQPFQQSIHHPQQSPQHHVPHAQQLNSMPPPQQTGQQQQLQQHQIQQNVSQHSAVQQNSAQQQHNPVSQQMNGSVQHVQQQNVQQGQSQVQQPTTSPQQQFSHQQIAAARRRNHLQQTQSIQRQQRPTTQYMQIQSGAKVPHHQFVERQVRVSSASPTTSGGQFSSHPGSSTQQQLQQIIRQHHANEAQLQQQQSSSSSQAGPSRPSSNTPSPHPGTPFQDRSSPNVQAQQHQQHNQTQSHSQPHTNGPTHQGLPVQMARTGTYMSAARSGQQKTQVVVGQQLPLQHVQPQTSLQQVLTSSPAKPLPLTAHRITNQQGQQVIVSASHANMPVRNVLVAQHAQQAALLHQQQQQSQHHSVSIPGPSHISLQPHPRTQALSALFISDEGVPITTPKEQYRIMKKKFKYLVYENECYQAELRNLQKKLLKLSRDKNFLLDRLSSYEKLSDSSDDDSDSSVKTTLDDKPKAKKKNRSNRKRPAPGPPVDIAQQKQASGLGQAIVKKTVPQGGIHQMLAQQQQHQQAMLQQRLNSQQSGPTSVQQQNHVQIQRSASQQGPSESRGHSGHHVYPGPSHLNQQGPPSVQHANSNQHEQPGRSNHQQSQQVPSSQAGPHMQVGHPGHPHIGNIRVKEHSSQQGSHEVRHAKMEQYQNGPTNGPSSDGQRLISVPNGSDGAQQFVRQNMASQQLQPRQQPAPRPMTSLSSVHMSQVQQISPLKQDIMKQETSEPRASSSNSQPPPSPQSTLINGTKESQSPHGKLE